MKPNSTGESEKRWRCGVCGYEMSTCPMSCPVCGAPDDSFVEVDPPAAADRADGQR